MLIRIDAPQDLTFNDGFILNNMRVTLYTPLWWLLGVAHNKPFFRKINFPFFAVLQEPEFGDSTFSQTKLVCIEKKNCWLLETVIGSTQILTELL